jgi:CRP/FNR family transcriptional regulator, cyclic AMP receptor protein
VTAPQNPMREARPRPWRRERVVTTARRRFPLLELDSGLGELLPAERRLEASLRLAVELHRFAPGEWNVEPLAGTSRTNIGLLVLDGMLAREVMVADTLSTELLGPQEVVRPWAMRTPELLPVAVRWMALTETRAAVLDRRFGARLAEWPEINAVLIERLTDRAQRLATVRAISQLTRVEDRLLAFFWHLAERWGRVTAQGTTIPLTLSHRLLGQLVGAQRPTVTNSIGELARRGVLARRPNGTWLLTGEPAGSLPVEVQPIIPIRRRLLAPRGFADHPATRAG